MEEFGSMASSIPFTHSSYFPVWGLPKNSPRAESPCRLRGSESHPASRVGLLSVCGGWEEGSEPEGGGPSGGRTHIACGHWPTHPHLADDGAWVLRQGSHCLPAVCSPCSGLAPKLETPGGSSWRVLWGLRGGSLCLLPGLWGEELGLLITFEWRLI